MSGSNDNPLSYGTGYTDPNNPLNLDRINQLALGPLYAPRDPTANVATVGAGAGVPSFKEWFGRSKVVDPSGDPLVVYHGTNKAFQEYDPSQGVQRTDAPGFATFFTDDPALASSYAARSGRSGQNVRPAYLSMQNPVETTGRSWFALNSPLDGRLWSDRYNQYVTINQGDEISINDLAKMALQQGYDGVIARNVPDPARTAKRDDTPQTTYAVFGPHQVRSAVGGAPQ